MKWFIPTSMLSMVEIATSSDLGLGTPCEPALRGLLQTHIVVMLED